MRRLAAWIRAHELGLLLTLVALLMLGVYLAPNIFIFVGSGERGVLWRRFQGGTDLRRTFPEGTNVIFPWDTLTIYDTRDQILDETFDTLSSNGLTVQVQLGIRYRPDRERLALLHQEVGVHYLAVVVRPEVGAALRAVIARYRPEMLYTDVRLQVQAEAVALARPQMAERYVFLDDLQIRSVVLPQTVQDAIESKLAEEQRFLQYEFTLARERQEAERKRLEAAGIRDFQLIVSNGISREYLQWKGIEATLDLAKSSNAKVVIVGSPTNGLPIILNTETTAGGSGQITAPTTTAPATTAPTTVPPAPIPAG